VPQRDAVRIAVPRPRSPRRLAYLKGFASGNDVRVIFREEVKDLRADVKDIRKQLDELNNKVANIADYRKEIDYALERIAAIEKHLGIKRRIAA
jgi:hypothetical protein